MYVLPRSQNLLTDGLPYNAFKESCPCGTTAAYVDSNGDVKYCLFDEKILGNICDDPFLTIWNSALTEEVRDERCPLDRSGSNCSSFKLLYSQFNDYHVFMNEYSKKIKETKYVF